jgi:Fe2+ or Zn2+ uptake regulation protein
MGIEEIFLAISRAGGSEGIASIYRNLKELEIAGAVQRTWGDGRTRNRVVYRLPAGLGDEDVVALVCEVCNRQLKLLDPVLREALARAMGEREGKPFMPVAVQVVCLEPPCCSLSGERSDQETSSQ